MGSDDASVVDNYYNVDENDGLNDKKNEKRYKQKIVSGLGEMLKQLTGECKECEEDGESDSTAVIETDPVYFDCVEMIEIEEAPGLSKAQKTFDQLGYVFKTDFGERFPKTPAIRYARYYCI